MLKEAVSTSRDILLEQDTITEDSMTKLSLFMAISAGTTQLIATNAIKTFSDDEEEKEKE